MGRTVGSAVTQDELDALPECGVIGLQEMGHGLWRPVMLDNFALFTAD